MAIVLNKGQEKARKLANEWWHKKEKQVFALIGRAGTGKTTIVRSLIEDINLDIRKEVIFVTYVGKATLPLRMNGLLAKTIHSTIMIPSFQYKYGDDGFPLRTINNYYKKKIVMKDRESLDKNIKLIVLDEAGMTNDVLFEKLKKFGIPIIALGDDAQLPPVFGKSTILKNADAILTEPMRQKKGDAILDIANMILRDEEIPLGEYGKNVVVTDDDILQKQLSSLLIPDIVITATNKTRDYINDTVRYKLKKFKTEFPEIGDKMVCRKNNWNICVNDISLINGLFGYVDHIDISSYNGHKLNIDFKVDFMDEYFEDIDIDMDYMKMTRKEKNEYCFPKANLFEYGYGSTCHLVQGSQFDSVMVIEEKMGNAEFQRRLMYTAVTRAKKNLIIVKKKPKKNFSFEW